MIINDAKHNTQDKVKIVHFIHNAYLEWANIYSYIKLFYDSQRLGEGNGDWLLSLRFLFGKKNALKLDHGDFILKNNYIIYFKVFKQKVSATCILP